MEKKSGTTSSKFNKMTKIVIWIMLIAMLGSGLISVVYSVFINM
ncbi:DUF4044 domain-containing protein [Trichococcus palustris]|nr:DUF4044 domain-containing protein [Trichococcus palustris]